ncbi:hypothetical protein RFI_24113 [Reticulomyxa filosa]|uniref:Uncharacterized protein n=1 Tax=Reticulomyxa filosa TaxID=46433 RepID=X6MIJ1_RETFI|nr:hypothetical protein RFI_24113 [Reticulomyxa filosa]|eukprot:ETO13262.1 hypothetical protein RFI_24113 [Reticulomyxa filosa]
MNVLKSPPVSERSRHCLFILSYFLKNIHMLYALNNRQLNAVIFFTTLHTKEKEMELKSNPASERTHNGFLCLFAYFSVVKIMWLFVLVINSNSTVKKKVLYIYVHFPLQIKQKVMFIYILFAVLNNIKNNFACVLCRSPETQRNFFKKMKFVKNDVNIKNLLLLKKKNDKYNNMKKK